MLPRIGGLSKSSRKALTGEGNNSIQDQDENTTHTDVTSEYSVSVSTGSQASEGENSVETFEVLKFQESDEQEKIPDKARLKTSTLRRVIEKHLGDFHQSESIFEIGGIKRAKFFCKKDEISGEKTYITFAHDRDPENLKGQLGGEQSISTVLQTIKEDLKKGNNESNAKIFILLQQVKKEHWTLLAITLAKDATSGNNKYTAAATHYDSKALVSTSKFKDLFSSAPAYINGCVKDNFSTTKGVKYKYEGTQSMVDTYNCGRYTLIKLLKLINPNERDKTIEEINKMINEKD